MEIFNQVIGAADNSECDHVFLVTSSDFTSHVLAAADERQRLSQERRRNAKFKNVVVDLVDGKRIAEWLRQYKVSAPMEGYGSRRRGRCEATTQSNKSLNATRRNSAAR